jgi:hypothetical protein
VRPDGSVTLQVLQSGRSVSLKPGQSVELLSGAIEEGYLRRIEAPKPEPKSPVTPSAAAKPAADARKAKPASGESAQAEREREDRETQRLEDAISRALTETASARPGAAPAPPAPETRR